jgi:hypothetical protein
MWQRMGIFRKAVVGGLALGFGLLASSVSMTSPVQAQWYGYRHHYFVPQQPPVIDMVEMSPRDLSHAVRSQGFNRPSRPIYQDEVAVLTAVHPNGQPVRITIDIYSGQILNLAPVANRKVARVRPEARQVSRDDEPLKRSPRIVERSPELRPPARRAPEAERGMATPEKPTIVRRAPMLPAQSGKPPLAEKPDTSPEKPMIGQAASNLDSVGSGTRSVPRRIEIAPPTPSDAPSPPI